MYLFPKEAEKLLYSLYEVSNCYCSPAIYGGHTH